ncbi:hypothetical protein EVAR_77604_1 [Eumeta japonica]|uniref:Uncharacterized protein n=1 Tax=Eumeta variegata TaxID=151549 RepID=A0A4C1T7N8_EUMVA|nr:hypothetical protein EVAR_77604_1 [Eumeta japonica]
MIIDIVIRGRLCRGRLSWKSSPTAAFSFPAAVISTAMQMHLLSDVTGTLAIIGSQGLIMEPEGSNYVAPKYSIIKQRIRAVFTVVGTVLECTFTVIGLQGLMMEPEGRHWYSIMKQRSLAVFGLVDILVEYSLTMIGFQGLIIKLEVWKLHHQTLKVNCGKSTF